jgi:hypothetical protein
VDVDDLILGSETTDRIDGSVCSHLCHGALTELESIAGTIDEVL